MLKFGGSWSESKLDSVENYAKSYLKVMQKQPWFKLHYVDAFAGRGKQALRSGSEPSAHFRELDSFFGNESERSDTEEFLVGSAIRALRASGGSKRPFDRLLFIDVDQASCRELEDVVQSEFPETRQKVEVICSDADAALQKYISTVDWNRTRALVFLDPYGLEVGWSIIERLAETCACDVWYLFPLGGVIRMMTKSGQIPDSWRALLNQVFGTDNWYDEFYQKDPQPQLRLFNGDEETRIRNATTERVVDFTRECLKKTFRAVSDAGILRNSKGSPLFALILGVSSGKPGAQKVALGIANHLVKGLNQQ